MTDYELKKIKDGRWALSGLTENLKERAVIDVFETTEEAIDAFRGLGVTIKVFL